MLIIMPFSCQFRDCIHKVLLVVSDITSEADTLVGRWRRLQVKPVYVPQTKGAGDSSNFDKYDEKPLKTLPNDKYEREFRDF